MEKVSRDDVCVAFVAIGEQTGADLPHHVLVKSGVESHFETETGEGLGGKSGVKCQICSDGGEVNFAS